MIGEQMSFYWRVGEAPPLIAEHTEAKLRVLRQYLRAYFDTLVAGRPREHFKLDLVDGFAGGGTYSDGKGTLSGSPLVMIEESSAAEQRLTKDRRKQLLFDVRHYFVEADRAHADHLSAVLHERRHLLGDGKIVLFREKRFDDVVREIISQIKKRQPRAGRSIFLLDQCGFSKVGMDTIRLIRDALPRAEVILTFAVDNMLNPSTPEEIVQYCTKLGLPADGLRQALRRGDDHRRAALERVLPELALEAGFKWVTPFFLRPAASRRTLWFIHLSHHATARDVMLRCHWEVRNSTVHYGDSLGPAMLGWEALERKTMPLLTFTDEDRNQMRESSFDELPRRLRPHLQDAPMRVEKAVTLFGNDTAMTSEDMTDILIQARNLGEIEVRNADGKVRSGRGLRHLNRNDRIVLPSQTLLFVPSSKDRLKR